MPISTSSFGDDRDNRYQEYEKGDLFDQETLTFSGLSLEDAEAMLKRLGGGVAEKHSQVEGIGWKADYSEVAGGIEVVFSAHEELLDDLIMRFEHLAGHGN